MKPIQLTLDSLFDSLVGSSKKEPCKTNPIKLVEVFVGMQSVRLCADGKVMMTTVSNDSIESNFLCGEIEELFINDLVTQGIADECLTDDTQWERVIKRI